MKIVEKALEERGHNIFYFSDQSVFDLTNKEFLSTTTMKKASSIDVDVGIFNPQFVNGDK